MSEHPKDKPIILSGNEYHEFRKLIAQRAGYRCEYCDRYAPFDSETQVNGEVSHIGKRKFYGDTPSNAKWSCLGCHRKKHDGNLTA